MSPSTPRSCTGELILTTTLNTQLSPMGVILTNVDMFSLHVTIHNANGEFPLRYGQIVRDPGDDGGGADGDLGQPRGPGELKRDLQ